MAVDELYDGPFCVLSLVDNRTFKRIAYEILNRDPTQADIAAFLRRFQGEWDCRNLVIQGITTDGSNLYPGPISLIFPGVRHQVCEFHVLKDLTKAVLRAVAKIRKALAAQMPKVPRGRATSQRARKAIRRKQRLAKIIQGLFEHRHLFVQRELTPAERKIFQRITRGQPLLRRLREIMEEVYRLFDRRCRTDTALAKLAKLRQRVARLKEVAQVLSKLSSPTVEKALTFLDDKLLPSTSNAVARGNRRHRKMQKSVYRVRSHTNLRQRMALDLLRDARATARAHTAQTLHHARAG